MNRQASDAIARAFVKEWEKLRLEAYRDGGGVWTIGWGHTGPEVRPGMRISERQADLLLVEDMAEATAAVDRLATVPLTDHQRAALISFAFNVGVGAFEDSTLLRELNGSDYAGVPAQLRRWVYDNGKIVEGLRNRREAEIALWRTPDAPAAPPAPPPKPVAVTVIEEPRGFWQWLKGLFAWLS